MNKLKMLGDKGELEAAYWLISKGYRILNKNFHSRYGEIDIIAQNNEYIVFIEVKTRCEDSLVSGKEAVNKSKQLKIMKTAINYLVKNDINKQPRFDVMELTVNKLNEVVKIVHYENAFTGDGYDSFF